MTDRLVSDEFDVPAGLDTPQYRLRMLTVNDVVKDYDAVMSSVEHLKGVLDPNSNWPEGLSIEQDLIDLGWHQKEFQERSSFAYTMMTPNDERCLGCVYVYRSEEADADVFMWVRRDEYERLDVHLETAVREWIESDWPFNTVHYPGRGG
jgi:hypothetical protein